MSGKTQYQHLDGFENHGTRANRQEQMYVRKVRETTARVKGSYSRDVNFL